jgi:outer membrane protein assembly factor BamB
MTQPVSVLPANARAIGLNMVDNVIYVVTSHECNETPNAVWAVDLTANPPRVRSFELKAASGWGLGGPVIGSDGTVYALNAGGLVALSPRDLQLKQSVSFQGKPLSDAVNVASPVVMAGKDRDLIVSPCAEGRLCLMDSSSVIERTPRLAEREITGSLSSWQDRDGTRWVLASANGAAHPDLKFPVTNGAAPNGFIAAFKVQQQGGKTTLAPAWMSRDLDSPMPPVIANGVVFTLSAGEITRRVSDNGNSVEERPRGSTHATLYALDAQTGKELYSSRNLVNVPAALTGLTVANGRVYFGGIDGTLYAFGLSMEQ